MTRQAQLRGLAKVPCAGVTVDGRGCKAIARWTLPSDPDFYCKTHATIRALTNVGDGRMVNTVTGRTEIPTPANRRPPKPRTGPVPVGKEAIIAELGRARCWADFTRCRLAIIEQIGALKDERLGLKPDLRAAVSATRRRLLAVEGGGPA